MMSAEVGKSSWIVGAITGFVFVIGAATTTLGFLKAVEDRADASPKVVEVRPADPAPPPVAAQPTQVAVAQPQPQPAPAPVAEASLAPVAETPAVSQEPVAQIQPVAQAEPAAQARPAEENPLAILSRPSFDCDRASTHAEQMICGSPDLARLDGRMARLYRYGRRERLLSHQTVAEQRIWLQLREACSTEACLKQAYEERIAQLKNEMQSS